MGIHDQNSKSQTCTHCVNQTLNNCNGNSTNLKILIWQTQQMNYES